MEQRTYKRKPVLWSAILHRDGRVLQCAVLHISAGGARIRIHQRFDIDSTVVLMIDRLGTFPGEIRWQRGTYAGIRFLEDAQVVEKRFSAALSDPADAVLAL